MRAGPKFPPRRKYSAPTMQALEMQTCISDAPTNTSDKQRRKSSPSILGGDLSQASYQYPLSSADDSWLSSEDYHPLDQSRHHKNKPTHRRKANRHQKASISNSDEEKSAETRQRAAGPRSNSVPLSLADSSILRKKISMFSKRSNSDNNFLTKTKIIRVAGCTYKLTMKAHTASDDDETSRTTDGICPPGVRSRVNTSVQSNSLPREEAGGDLNGVKRVSLTSNEMSQAQKWVSEREELARKINLNKPARLPSTDDEHENGVVDDSCGVLPGVDTREALNCAALRLRRMTQELDKGNFTPMTLKETLQYAISVLEMKFLNHASYSDDDSDADASLPGDSVVPPEIKMWLMQTFSTSGVDGNTKQKGERRKLRSVVHAMQAGMFVERMFRKSSAAAHLDISPDIQSHVKGIASWEYDIFELETVSSGQALKYTFYEVLSKYDFIRTYKISMKSLFAFCDRLQIGYKKHNNRYHNPTHAADVTQCISVFLDESGFVNWLTDLEIFAMIFAAAVHDLEHTGTTNNFHTQTRSSLALLYNDKSVLENHHVSAAFRILWEDPECDILSSLSKEDYKQFRELVVEMVLSTDMSLHFGQIKNIKAMLQYPEKVERSKAMSLMMHCADISHPTRPWQQHHRWTERLMEEFFEQGDKERELRLPLSPLVDRHSTMVAQSQIGFIDYVIKPTFDVLHDLFWRVSASVIGESLSSEDETKGGSPFRRVSTQCSTKSPNHSSPKRFSEEMGQSMQASSKAALKAKIKAFRSTISHCMKSNRQKWVEKDKEEQLAKQRNDLTKEPQQR